MTMQTWQHDVALITAHFFDQKTFRVSIAAASHHSCVTMGGASAKLAR